MQVRLTWPGAHSTSSRLYVSAQMRWSGAQGGSGALRRNRCSTSRYTPAARPASAAARNAASSVACADHANPKSSVETGAAPGGTRLPPGPPARPPGTLPAPSPGGVALNSKFNQAGMCCRAHLSRLQSQQQHSHGVLAMRCAHGLPGSAASSADCRWGQGYRSGGGGWTLVLLLHHTPNAVQTLRRGSSCMAAANDTAL